MYSCEIGLYDRGTSRSRNCIFSNVSACMGFVPGSDVCNRHLAPFNLKQVYSHYHDANNEQWARVNLYMIGNLNIPLFRTIDGTVDAVEIRKFANAAKYQDPQLNEIAFANALACAMEISAVQPEKTNSWLEDTPVYVIDQDGVYNFMNLPYLHRMLFRFALPSYTIRPGAAEQDILIPNVVLEYNPHLVDTQTFRFKVPNAAKGITLLHTDNENSVASPVVLEASHTGNQERAVRCFSTKPKSSGFGIV